jgi:hypothetical protein
MVGNHFQLLEEPDLEVLSRSDIRALDEAVALFKHGGWRALYRAAHDSAWKVAWDRARDCGIGSTAIRLEAIASTMPNAAALVDYLSDPCPGEAEDSERFCN